VSALVVDSSSWISYFRWVSIPSCGSVLVEGSAMTKNEALAILGKHRDELKGHGVRALSLFGSVAPSCGLGTGSRPPQEVPGTCLGLVGTCLVHRSHDSVTRRIKTDRFNVEQTLRIGYQAIYFCVRKPTKCWTELLSNQPGRS
jgi:hypothetical protein